MKIIKLEASFLKNDLGLPFNSNNVIEDIIIDTSRWSIAHEVIFKYNSKFYRTTYSIGSTECQDESPWEYDDEVECYEVEEKEVLVKKWVNVE